MKKLYLMVMGMLMLQATNSNAQCPSGRYMNEIFANYSIDSVTYSTVYGQKMDIYQPVGDTIAARPLIILAHGGSFVGGDRHADSSVLWLCRNFAKRGYVTVSIDYRLTNFLGLATAAGATDEVTKAISDGKAAIRYFMKDRATTNTYKIDTNNIFIGGNSAGAVLYMHVGYLDSIGECSASIQAAMVANGGFEGNSGNAGYTTKSRAIINLAGALNATTMAGPGDKPSVNCQGDLDNVVPFNCGFPISGVVPVTLCGLGQLEAAYTSSGIYHMSRVFVGDGHVPWNDDLTKFATVDSLVKIFLYNMVCVHNTGIDEQAVANVVKLYPNPATTYINVEASQAISTVTICDATGRTVREVNNVNHENYELNTAHLASGVYFVRIRFANENYAPLVKRIVIE